ncbi:MAG: hypothetical protein JNL73_13975 [Anaerolineales bacterium]|nr:hypothetical protein [Anaerolineales bacterium]
MNTTLKIAAVAVATAVVVGAFALVGAGLAQAQGGTPWGYPGMMGNWATPQAYGPAASGYGRMGGPGTHMRGTGAAMMAGVDANAMHTWMADTGGMHTLVWASLAETLGLTPDELSAQLAAGQTLAQIAEAQGVSQEQITTTLQAAMTEGLQQAVADGALTQAQADQMTAWMTARGAPIFAHMGAMGGYGPGSRDLPTTPQVVP